MKNCGTCGGALNGTCSEQKCCVTEAVKYRDYREECLKDPAFAKEEVI